MSNIENIFVTLTLLLHIFNSNALQTKLLQRTINKSHDSFITTFNGIQIAECQLKCFWEPTCIEITVTGCGFCGLANAIATTLTKKDHAVFKNSAPTSAHPRSGIQIVGTQIPSRMATGPNDKVIVGPRRLIPTTTCPTVNAAALADANQQKCPTNFVSIPGTPTLTQTTNPYSGTYPTLNVLTNAADDTTTPAPANFWLLPNGVLAHGFVLDYGSEYTIGSFLIKNTHNRNANDRGTKDFEIHLSNDNSNWMVAICDTLDDERNTPTIPTKEQRFQLVPIQKARYVKFLAKSAYGEGAGLLYFQTNS